MKSIPAVGIALWVGAYAESEREYWRSVYDSYQWKKEFKILEEDVDFWLFTVKADSHWGKMLANNPSLTYDSWESWIYDGMMKKVTWKPELSMAEVFAARAMGKFFSDNFWNPMNRYEITSITRWYDSIKNRNEKGEVAPWFRNDLELWYAIVKMIIPWATRDLIPAIHKDIFDEPLWKTLEDNYQLGKTLKNNPERTENVNKMTFAEQSKFADAAKTAYTEKTEESKKTETVNGKKEAIKAIVHKKLWPTPSEKDFKQFIQENKQLFIDAWLDTPEARKSFYTSFKSSDIGKTLTNEYSHYYGADSDVIYTHFLQKYVKSWDKEGYYNMLNELNAQWVVLNVDGFKKKMSKRVKEDRGVK